MDTRRHAPLARSRTLVRQDRSRQLPQVYLGRRRRPLPDVYHADHAEHRPEGRFRWLLSTVLAATVGGAAIAVMIVGSMEEKSSDGILPSLERFRQNAMKPFNLPTNRAEDGLKWATPKSDKLQVASGVRSVKQVIHESMRQRRSGREFIKIKPYARITAKLAPIPDDSAYEIPPFNPFKLYSAGKKQKRTGIAGALSDGVKVQVVELLGGILPAQDGQELDNDEVTNLVSKANGDGSEAGNTLIRASFNPAGANSLLRETPAQRAARTAPEPIPPQTTVLVKTGGDNSDPSGDVDIDNAEQKAVRVKRGDTLIKLIVAEGAELWQAKEMVEEAKDIFPPSAFKPGQEVHFTLVPSVNRQGKLEPIRFSIFSAGQIHRVTVKRDASGSYTASRDLADGSVARALVKSLNQGPTPTTLYASLYHAALSQGIKPETVLQILRIHAYDTDFRQRVRIGDSAEFFFDVKDDNTDSAKPETLLSTTITSGGATKKFYRFRSKDGRVDYFDEYGNNSKKFITRKPVRSGQVRLTSGYGMRFHPVRRIRRMHTGIDWAAPRGTPIMAAGNGTIEQIGRKGGNGNYIRIRHANGYKTAYSHMRKFAPGLRQGSKVRQGQVIGQVGNTGLSTGPHLHFEVLVNNQFINPMRMRVPQERRLRGRDLAAFQKERSRIDALARHVPVKTELK